MVQASPHIMYGKGTSFRSESWLHIAKPGLEPVPSVSRLVLYGQVKASFWSSPDKNCEGLSCFLLSGGPGLWNEASLLTLSLELACQELGQPQTAASCTPGFQAMLSSEKTSLFSLKSVALLG